MEFIARSAFPFLLLMILAVAVIIIFSEIALWLPQQMIESLK
jgi:TRAP-type C4-dicarboxylate transport system permease large subunit